MRVILDEMDLNLIKIFRSLPGWQRGSQGLGLTLLLMAAIVAILFFSFWVVGVGPFSSGKGAEAVNSMRYQKITNPGATAFHPSGSENYSSDVTRVLNKLQDSTDASTSGDVSYTPTNTGHTQSNP